MCGTQNLSDLLSDDRGSWRDSDRGNGPGDDFLREHQLYLSGVNLICVEQKHEPSRAVSINVH